MYKALVILAAMAACATAIPARCESPARWTAKTFMVNSRRGHEGEIEGTYAYDAIGKRKAIIDRVLLDNRKDAFFTIELFNEKKYYSLNLKTRQCEVGNLTYPFIDHGVVGNATFRGDVEIGSNALPEAGVELEIWSHTFEREGRRSEWTGVFTRTGCVPVRSTVFQDNNDFFVEEFFDVTAGYDPDMFVVPPECQ